MNTASTMSLPILLCTGLLCTLAHIAHADAGSPTSAPARQYLDRNGEVTYSLVDGYPLKDKDGKVLAEVTLRVLSPAVPSNKRLQLEWTLSNSQPRGAYLNPGFHYRMLPTGDFIFFDREGRYLPLPGKEGSYLAADWMFLQPGEKFTATSAQPLWFPPGRYCVQLVYFKQLLTPPSGWDLPPVQMTQPFGRHEELFRSNPVWFDIVAPERGPATQPAKPSPEKPQPK